MSKYDFLHEKGWQAEAKKRLDLSDPETLIGACEIRSSLMYNAPISIRGDKAFYQKFAPGFPQLMKSSKCDWSPAEIIDLINEDPNIILWFNLNSLPDNGKRFEVLCHFLHTMHCDAVRLYEHQIDCKLDHAHYGYLIDHFSDKAPAWVFCDHTHLMDDGYATSLLKILPFEASLIYGFWNDVKKVGNLKMYRKFLEVCPTLFKEFPLQIREHRDLAVRAAAHDPTLARHWPHNFYTPEMLRDVIIKWPLGYALLDERDRNLDLTLLACAGDSQAVWSYVPAKWRTSPLHKEYLEEVKEFGAVP